MWYMDMGPRYTVIRKERKGFKNEVSDFFASAENMANRRIILEEDFTLGMTLYGRVMYCLAIFLWLSCYLVGQFCKKFESDLKISIHKAMKLRETTKK